jgi:hypothetical protein
MVGDAGGKWIRAPVSMGSTRQPKMSALINERAHFGGSREDKPPAA